VDIASLRCRLPSGPERDVGSGEVVVPPELLHVGIEEPVLYW
jgi:hypothetical protein